MGKQYYGQVESITGNSYTVELHHKTLTPIPPATAKEINLSVGGFELDYEGQGSATYENNIMGSSCTIEISVDDSDVFTGLEQMAESRENDWLMIIYKGQDLFWHGTVVNDQITLPRASYQGTPSITVIANDRLKLLSSIEFDFGTFSLPKNRERGLEIIKQIIQRNNDYVTDLYGASDRYLLDSIQSKGLNQADGTLYNTSYTKESFIQNFTLTGDFGEEDEYIKCTDAIKQILQVFNAQILLTNGYYVIRQVENQFTSSTEFNAYTKTLGALSVYTISNGINVQDNARSCFEAIPEYTFQPVIREISTEISKSRIDYFDTTTASAVLGTLSNTDVGDLTYLFANIVVKLKDILTQYENGGNTYYANDVKLFADFWVKNSSGQYFYLNDKEIKLYGNTEPNYYELIGHQDIENYPSEILDFIYEVRLPDEDIVEYNLEIVARTSWYGNIMSYYNNPTKRSNLIKFTHIEDTIAKSRIGIQFSYNRWDIDETADYGLTQKFANNIASANANVSNNVTLGNLYHSGQIADIYGVQYYNNTTSEWDEPNFSLVSSTSRAKAEVLPLIMAANVYESTIKTIEGNLNTNGSIYAINSIQLDSYKWVFNGGTFDAQNEVWSGQWIKVAFGNIDTGTGGTKYNDRFRGGNSGLGDIFKSIDQRLIRVMSSTGNQGEQMMQAVFNDIDRTANPTTDQSLGLFIDYDATSESYLFNLKEIAEGGLPFNVTSDTSSVPFGATVNITLTGSYFKEDSVVSISKGTLNTTTINSSEEMVLNITAIASAEAVNTCDVTIDGVTFTALWTYEIVWTAELVPGDGTTVWNTTGSMTTGEGFISFPNNGSNWAQGGWFEELPDAATTFELLLDPLREGTTGTNHYGTAGLGAPVTSIPGYPTVDHGFYFASTTAIPLVNGGTSAGSLSWANGDTFKLTGTNTSGDSWDLVWTKISGGVSTEMKTQTVTISAELDFQCAILRYRKYENIVLKYLTP